MRTNRHFSLVAASLVPVVLAACGGTPVDSSGKASGQSSTQAPSTEAPLSGVEMFRGLAFGQGRGARLVTPTAEQWTQKNQTQAQFATNFGQMQRVARAHGASAENLQKLDEFSQKVASGEVTPEAWVTQLGDAGDRVVAAIQAQSPTFFDEFRAALTSGDRVRIKDALAQAGRLAEANLPKDAASVRGSKPELLIILLVIAVVAVVVLVKQPIEPNLQHDMMIDRLASDLAGT